ncbi:MAG: methyltransferase domain-containing protein [Propionibacteriaceae bacterium]
MTQHEQTAEPAHPHAHDEGGDIDVETMFSPAFWDERYSMSDKIWSGNPNPRLVEHISGVEAGTALDVGSGEGADAIWLAERGWRVTGIDVSVVALERAAQHASARGADIAERITWQQVDLMAGDVLPDSYDLVTAQFMHLPGREALHRRLAAAVRPGGILLIVGHHPSDLETMANRWKLRELMFTAEDIVPTLEPHEWEILVADAPSRQAVDPAGAQITIHDAVLLARRRIA